MIPTLDEASALDALLPDLHVQRDVSLRIVVADGGSTDDTVEIARRHGAQVVTTSAGRARQMNAGRRELDTPWLLFLHADTRLDDDELLRRAIDAMRAEPGQCGHFRMTFRDDDERLRFLEAKTALNRPNTTNGDQGLFVSAPLFDALGGFDESLPFLEDQRFAKRARTLGARWITLPGEISTSARRFEIEGFGRRYFAMALIMAAWAGGADEFFDAAPDAYVPNPEGQLDLRPLLRAVRTATRRMGSRSIRVWLDAARFAREHAWQLFFAADVALSDELPEGEHPFLDLYDRRIASLLDHPIIDVAIAAIAFVGLTSVLPAWLAVSEERTA